MPKQVHPNHIRYRWLQTLGLEFWLPLPLLAAIFWFGTGLVTDQVLSRPHRTENKLQADTQLEIRFAVSVARIKANVDREEGITHVEVWTTDSVLKKLEFEFPVTEFNQLESTIAQEIGLSPEDVRKLARYQVVN